MNDINMMKVYKKANKALKHVFKFITSTKHTKAEKYTFLKDIKSACEWQMTNFKGSENK